MITKYGYDAGTNPVAMMGRMRPFGRRVLLRAILEHDAYIEEKRAKGERAIEIVAYNTSDAVCFEVLGVGGGVARWCAENGETPPVVGDHCEMRSTAADRVHAREQIGRFWLVDVEDVAAVWAPVQADDPELLAAITAWREIKTNAVTPTAPGNGSADLEPRTHYASTNG